MSTWQSDIEELERIRKLYDRLHRNAGHWQVQLSVLTKAAGELIARLDKYAADFVGADAVTPWWEDQLDALRAETKRAEDLETALNSRSTHDPDAQKIAKK